MNERSGGVTLNGEPMTVMGEQVTVGAPAPGFRLTASDGSPRTMDDYTGRPLFISVVPNLETGICDLQTKRFEQEASAFADRVAFVAISADTLEVQESWCGEAGLARVELLHDAGAAGFGDAWGTRIKEMGREQRSVFVVDADGVVQYAEYVPEIAQHPDYAAALAALRGVAA